MRADTDNFFNEIRVPKLPGLGEFVFEIDLDDKDISRSEPVAANNNDLLQLQNRLPSSYLSFLKNVANGVYISIGNALRIYPVGNEIRDFDGDVLTVTNKIISDPLFPSKDFIFFASTGGGEYFAFYTAVKSENGEHPIVWFTPGDIDGKPFVLMNTAFDRFLTMQYYLLKSTDYEELYTYEEAKANTSNTDLMEQEERNYQRFQDLLYETFDPKVPKPDANPYKSTKSFNGLLEVVQKIS